MRTDQTAPEGGILEDSRRSPVLWVHAVVDDLGLSAPEFRIYAHLARRAGSKNHAWPGVRTMAEACRLSRNTVREALEALEKRGMIRVTQREGASNLYQLQDPSAWTTPGPGLTQGGGSNEGQGWVNPGPGGGSNEGHEVIEKKYRDKIGGAEKKPRVTAMDLLTQNLPEDWLTNTALMANLAAWAKARAEAGKPIKPTVAHRQMAFLREQTLEDAIEIVRLSADNGWQGLFPLRGKSARQQKPSEHSAQNLELWGF